MAQDLSLYVVIGENPRVGMPMTPTSRQNVTSNVKSKSLEKFS